MYLANSTEEWLWERQNCAGCVHLEGCPILAVSMAYNHDQHGPGEELVQDRRVEACDAGPEQIGRLEAAVRKDERAKVLRPVLDAFGPSDQPGQPCQMRHVPEAREPDGAQIALWIMELE